MPATYAHYAFGKKVYEKLPKEEKQVISKGKDAYLLGLHGPDLLFYYYPFGKNRINQQGSQMHKKIAADFFDKGRTNYRQERDQVLRAYLYGFLCHFILDSECHPYINYYIEEKKLGHLEIETEFDRYLMVKNGLRPLEDIPVRHLISRKHTREQISSMFDRVSPRQIGLCICMFRRIITFFVCRTSLKRGILKMLSRITGQDKNIGGLIMDGRVHPECRESDCFLDKRLEHSVQIAVDEIEKYSRVLESGGLLSERLYRNYEEFL